MLCSFLLGAADPAELPQVPTASPSEGRLSIAYFLQPAFDAVTLAPEVKAMLTPPCILFSLGVLVIIYTEHTGGVGMALTSTPR
jgi:hypothetical protein